MSEPYVERRAHTIAQIQTMFNASQSGVYNWLNDPDEARRLKSFRIGTKRLVDARDLEDWLAARKAESQAA
ncbi:helix-turn-helix domain-containing protein [Pelagibius sp. Alg239-R121]|uniref:helix-turn-helix domain-containing protein n=1 Tax=Pelagibius sp. Alg239-R121 TaxID=2993448 RepID=UPI003460FA7A